MTALITTACKRTYTYTKTIEYWACCDDSHHHRTQTIAEYCLKNKPSATELTPWQRKVSWHASKRWLVMWYYKQGVKVRTIADELDYSYGNIYLIIKRVEADYRYYAKQPTITNYNKMKGQPCATLATMLGSW